MALTWHSTTLPGSTFDRPVTLHTLENGAGLALTLADFGAAIRSLKAPGRDGIREVTLAYRDPDLYSTNPYYLGVTVGRCANRIAGGRFRLGDRLFQLTRNDGNNHLHGGARGLSRRFWEGQPWQRPDRIGVTFITHSADGDEGYPGAFSAQVSYSLDAIGAVVIDYTARADRDGPINLTNHTYFNLTGTGPALSQELTLAAGQYLAVDAECIPTGELLAVAGGAMDFRRPRVIGLGIAAVAGGYDHFWVARSAKSDRPELLAILRDPGSGRTLELFSTEPGVQFYSGNQLDGTLEGASGGPLIRHAGVCLEPHIHPDAVNHPGFPSVVVRAGEPYRQRSIYRFSVT